MKRLLFILPLLIFAIGAAFLYWGLNPERDPAAIPSVLIDEPAPQFELPPIEASATPGLSTADLAGGQITVVNIFASWCLPCRAEHPLLVDLAEQRDVRLVGINYKDKPEDALAWLEELGNPYEAIGADENGRAGIEWGISGVPETFILDREGTIRYRHVGPIHAVELDDVILPILERLQ